MSANTFNLQTSKFLAVIGENMPEIPSALMQEWIEHPKDLQQVLWKALCPLKNVPRLEFKTWKIVKLGIHKSVKNLSRALTDSEFPIGNCAARILKKTSLATAETEIELVNVSVRDLGFEKSATRVQIYARATEYGLNPVPPEVGPQLRLQYSDQPLGEWVLMGMKPIMDSDGSLAVFRVVRHDDGQWLSSGDGDPDGMWSPDSRWAFARRKQK